MQSTVPQPAPPDLEALAARVAEVRQMGTRMLAFAADLEEGLRRVSAATGIPLLPSPGLRLVRDGG